MIVTDQLEATDWVVIANVALAEPADTVTLDGTAAEVLLLDKDTTAPSAGAGPLSVTVPVEPFPPCTVDGFRDRDDSEGGLTVRFDDRVTPLYKPEILTMVVLDTGTVAIVNVALATPAATVTLAGTAAASVLSLQSETIAPPGGAGPLSNTVPVDEVPPATEEGLSVTEESTG